MVGAPAFPEHDTVGEGVYRHFTDFAQLRKHTVYFAQPGSSSGKMPTFQRPHQGEELLVAESARTTKLGAGAQLDQPRHPANMIVMPVRRDDQSNTLSRLETDALQIAQGSRSTIWIKAGIDNDHAPFPTCKTMLSP